MTGVGGGGILVVDKTTGPTSHDVVAQVRRALGVRRVGHCGTLDPLASGVLVVCVGSTTRLSDWLSRGEKVYEAEFRLGAYSDTDDAEGALCAVVGAPIPTGEAVDAACSARRGWVEQVPPTHSAVKVDGVRSYRRARRNEPVSLAPRRVRIERLEVTGYEYPRLAVRVVCGKGTYIRSLARDLGTDLGCGAYVAALRRLRVGALGLQDAVGLEALRELVTTDMAVPFVDVRRALAGILEPLELDAVAAASFRHGSAVDVRLGTRSGECAVFAGEHLLGVGRFDDEGWLWPARVLGEMAHAV